MLVLLFQLHHCYDHPIFVISQGDTQRSCDLLKPPRRTLKGGDGVVEVLWKGGVGKFPICLEAFDDTGLATCAHGLCRECLLANWRSLTPRFCSVSRMMSMKQEHELVSAPTQNYF
ncbi:hypothetical protein ACH5RR_037188 [Cinchona calisaya]|uniref:Zinc finger RING-type eukaryotic domain-containing protein n=1 Tax=Cinchona calisaya TaxID=153742 RepID=A0ABD2Y5E7_9GENT